MVLAQRRRVEPAFDPDSELRDSLAKRLGFDRGLAVGLEKKNSFLVLIKRSRPLLRQDRFVQRGTQSGKMFKLLAPVPRSGPVFQDRCCPGDGPPLTLRRRPVPSSPDRTSAAVARLRGPTAALSRTSAAAAQLRAAVGRCRTSAASTAARLRAAAHGRTSDAALCCTYSATPSSTLLRAAAP